LWNLGQRLERAFKARPEYRTERNGSTAATSIRIPASSAEAAPALALLEAPTAAAHEALQRRAAIGIDPT